MTSYDVNQAENEVKSRADELEQSLDHLGAKIDDGLQRARELRDRAKGISERLTARGRQIEREITEDRNRPTMQIAFIAAYAVAVLALRLMERRREKRREQRVA